ncbi:hypothetical protein M3215_22760 [Bacillus cytotoxicus]|uniref:Uncharacterized protein n=1 Tax=Bacillus cytotoxicus TaxID=580165 RepID=A0ACC6ADT9_9BACI|nr:hypothetical protein [Bacillus cytotoxicus]
MSDIKFNYDPEHWIEVRTGQNCVWCGKRLESSDVSLNWCDPVCHECDYFDENEKNKVDI